MKKQMSVLIVGLLLSLSVRSLAVERVYNIRTCDFVDHADKSLHILGYADVSSNNELFFTTIVVSVATHDQSSEVFELEEPSSELQDAFLDHLDFDFASSGVLSDAGKSLFLSINGTSGVLDLYPSTSPKPSRSLLKNCRLYDPTPQKVIWPNR